MLPAYRNILPLALIVLRIAFGDNGISHCRGDVVKRQSVLVRVLFAVLDRIISSLCAVVNYVRKLFVRVQQSEQFKRRFLVLARGRYPHDSVQFLLLQISA